MHLRPAVGLARVLSLNVLELHHAGTSRVRDDLFFFNIVDIEAHGASHLLALTGVGESRVVDESAIDVTPRAAGVSLGIVVVHGANFLHMFPICFCQEEVGWHSLRLSAQVNLEGIFLHIIFLPEEK